MRIWLGVAVRMIANAEHRFVTIDGGSYVEIPQGIGCEVFEHNRRWEGVGVPIFLGPLT